MVEIIKEIEEIIDKTTEPIDFPRIIFAQVNECRKAISEGTREKYIRNVCVLDDLLCSDYDNEYKENVEKINKKYSPKMKGLHNPFGLHNPIDKIKITSTMFDYCREMFRELVKLIDRVGYKPEKSGYEEF